MLEKFCDILLFVLIFNVSDSASQDKVMGVASRKKNLEIDDSKLNVVILWNTINLTF